MPSEIIPVLDILDGVVVRGIAGKRESYKPIQSVLTDSTEPVTVLEALCAAFGPGAVYVADLDAIVHGKRDLALWRRMATQSPTPVRLWLDAGFADCDDLPDIPGLVPVIGLESQTSFAAFARIFVHAPEAVFSLDLKAGLPVAFGEWAGLSAVEIARVANEAGVKKVLLLDLEAVGMGNGTGTLDLVGELSSRFPNVEYYGGGGVTSREELDRLAAYNYSGILIASALHDGRIPSTLPRPIPREPRR